MKSFNSDFNGNTTMFFQVAGLPTNINFLQRLANHWAFEKGQVETNFIENFKSDLFIDPCNEIFAKEAYNAATLGATFVAACVCKEEQNTTKESLSGKLEAPNLSHDTS